MIKKKKKRFIYLFYFLNTPGTLDIRWNSTATEVHMPPEVAVVWAIDIDDLRQFTLIFCPCVNVATD